MKTMLRIIPSWVVIYLGLLSLLYLPAASAESLSDIDREIQADSTLRIDRGGLDGHNVYEGVTTSRLDRKIKILQAAGINSRFHETSDGLRDYTSFYSFTSTTGVTDTGLTLTTTDDNLRLYRRGSSGYKEASGYLGSWWGSSIAVSR
jgi:hypothetical protein